MLFHFLKLNQLVILLVADLLALGCLAAASGIYPPAGGDCQSDLAWNFTIC